MKYFERLRYIVQNREELPPHVYGISTSAYLSLKSNAMNQSILVSGESGAGKTETVKILMNHIAQISGIDSNITIEKVFPLLYNSNVISMANLISWR